MILTEQEKERIKDNLNHFLNKDIRFVSIDFQKFQNGEGYIDFYTERENKKITITKVLNFTKSN